MKSIALLLRTVLLSSILLSPVLRARAGIVDFKLSTWAPVDRPERVKLAAWNSPVPGTVPTAVTPAPEGSGPITVTISESEIADDFFGLIDLTIEGLSLGQTVRLEKFRVDNSQGIINAAAVLQESHLITDGVAAEAGEVYNFNRVNDVTDRDGRIESQLDFWEPGSASVAGEYVYRVSSPLASFPAQSARLTVTNAASDQGFSGRVTSDGQPVAGAIVALLDPLTGYADFLKGATTDTNGDYDLDAPFEDEFDLVALKPGHVGPFAVGTEWVLEEGETITANLALQPGTRTISGTLVNADTGASLPGVELFFISLGADDKFDNRLITVVWTDADGQFSAGVTPDRWGAFVRVETASKLGCVTSSGAPLGTADTTAGDVTGLTVPITTGSSIIWGTLTSSTLTDDNDEPLPLGGVEIMARNDDDGLAAWAVTDDDGDYRLAVPPGRWSTFAFSFSLEDSDHAGVVPRTLVLTETNQSLEYSFRARAKRGELYGWVTNANDDAIGRLGLLAFNADLDIDEGAVQATYASDGYYSFLLPPGEWLVYPDPEQSADRGLLFQDLPRVNIDAGGATEIRQDISAITPASTIQLIVTDNAARGLSNLLAHAFATVGQTTFHAFGRSDANGVFNLPAVPGNWLIHVKEETLGAYRLKELPLIFVNVTGASATASAQAEPYADTTPNLTSIQRENGQFSFTGSGESGRYYAIQASTNLVDWYEIGRARAVTNSFNLQDSSARSRLFYRVATE